jgi:hypothetical protein
LLKDTGDQVAAEQSYYRAITVAGRQSGKIWELRAANSLARLWRNLGKRSEARDLLAPIYGWFTEGFGTPVLRRQSAARGTGVNKRSIGDVGVPTKSSVHRHVDPLLAYGCWRNTNAVKTSSD